MAALGTILLVLGAMTAVVGSIWLLVLAFQESVLWGLGSLFIPLVSLIFTIMFWPKTMKPFLIAIGGSLVMFLGMAMSGPAIGP